MKETQEEVVVPMEVVGEVGVQDDPYFDEIIAFQPA